MHDRAYYHALRNEYRPDDLKLVIVAESPPISGKYFYDKTGAKTEPLFSALMQRLDLIPATKEDGLREFQRRGLILVDATYQQVNAKDIPRDEIIKDEYPHLVDDLTSLSPDRSVPIVLLKVNVCKILDPRLSKDGFKVINRGATIPFPSTGQQTKSKEALISILNAVGITL